MTVMVKTSPLNRFVAVSWAEYKGFNNPGFKMTDSKLVSLADRCNDSTYSSPEIALHDAMEDIGKRGAFKEGKHILILALVTFLLYLED